MVESFSLSFCSLTEQNAVKPKSEVLVTPMEELIYQSKPDCFYRFYEG